MKNKPRTKLAPGQTFTPFGTNAVGVVKTVHRENITYFYSHEREKTYTARAHEIGRFARIHPRSAA